MGLSDRPPSISDESQKFNPLPRPVVRSELSRVVVVSGGFKTFETFKGRPYKVQVFSIKDCRAGRPAQVRLVPWMLDH